MRDSTKTSLSCLSAISMVLLPIIGLGIGWIGWNIRAGLIAALVTFVVFFLLSGIFISTIREPSLLTSYLPLIFGSVYALLPDFIPGPIDDTAAFAGGALLSFSLWVKRNPDTPRWILFPLTAASIYTLVGGLIPGPVDELLAYIILGGGAIAYGTSSQLPLSINRTKVAIDTSKDYVDGEYKIE